MSKGPYAPVALALIASTLDCLCPYWGDETWVWQRCARCDSARALAEAAYHWQEAPHD